MILGIYPNFTPRIQSRNTQSGPNYMNKVDYKAANKPVAFGFKLFPKKVTTPLAVTAENAMLIMVEKAKNVSTEPLVKKTVDLLDQITEKTKLTKKALNQFAADFEKDIEEAERAGRPQEATQQARESVNELRSHIDFTAVQGRIVEDGGKCREFKFITKPPEDTNNDWTNMIMFPDGANEMALIINGHSGSIIGNLKKPNTWNEIIQRCLEDVLKQL